MATDTLEILQKENEELKQQNAEKADLISISAHQLRTSLSAMKWILKMFLDGDFGTLTPEQSNFMNKAYESDNRMIHVVNEMLSINHAEDPLQTMHLSHINIVKLVDEIAFDFTGEAYKRGIELIFLKPETTLAPLVADEEKMRVIIQNLIENGIKYSNKGGHVFINLHDSATQIELTVRDTGIGIAQSDQSHIFSKSYRTDSAKQQDAIGSGLGLYTTKRMVEKHNGKIWFESKPGDGTTFHVTIPRQK